jgi:ABC-type uncharacterized transport system substrate-binding protein
MSGCDEDRIRIAIAQAMEHRAVIEQAKGMLSVIYDIDDQAAFDVLRWRSQTTNTKLRALARQLIADFRSVRSALNSPSTSRYDALLLTAHERVAGTASVKDA